MRKVISVTLIILIMLPIVFCEEPLKKSVSLSIVDWHLFNKNLHIKSEITNKKRNPRGIKCKVVFKVKYKNSSSSYHSFSQMFMFVGMTKQEKTFKVVPDNTNIEYVSVHKFKYSFVKTEKLEAKIVIAVIVTVSFILGILLGKYIEDSLPPAGF